ncbi:ABC transporter permease [Modestobacter lapidis]|nr:ABC transporter permease [Modestobacter lapidis]
MSALAGTGALVRLALRRDRVRLPVWVIAVVGLLMSSVVSVTSLYGSTAEREAYAGAVGDNPVAVMMGGPGAGLPSLGGIVVFEVAIVGYVAVGLMSLLLVVRHTRAEEEAGRTELLRAAVVGRWAGPGAALVVAGAANAGIGLGVGAGLVATGLPAAGSAALAASFVVFGLVMATVGLVAAQLTEHSRGASGIAAAALAVFFVLRAAGDIGGGTLSWTSPMGWALAVRPFAGARWAVLLLPLAAAAVLTAAALALLDRRDVGAGLVAARPGRATASGGLAGPLGLAWRQHRAALLGWGIGMFLLGAAYGSVGESVEELVSQNDALAEFVAGSGTDLVDTFFAVATSMTALVVTGFALQVAVRMRGEETAGRLEPLLGTAVSRGRWLAVHLLVAVAGSTVLLALGGLGTGLLHATLTADPGQVGRLTVAALVWAPAAWALTGVAAALFGLLPRAVGAVWALLAAAAFLLLLGRTVQLPDWAVGLSPFEHVPQLPSEAVSAPPLLALTAVALALAGAGLLGFRRRDIG